MHSEVKKHQRVLNPLNAKVDEHEPGFQLVLDARERAFLTKMRNFGVIMVLAQRLEHLHQD